MNVTNMKPSQRIDQQISQTADWRGQVMKQLRRLIHEADPEINEEWKWDVGVYVHDGMVCAVSAFKDHVKINFFKGASLKDSKHILNSGLDSKNHRAVDFKEDDPLNELGLKKLITDAVVLNTKK